LDKDAYDEVMENSKPLQKILVLKDITVTLDQLYYLKELGYGTYGKVYLVHNQKTFYAVKAAEIKILSDNRRLTQYFLNEKSIMTSLDHPFIVQLVNTLKNKDYIFFVLEFIDGISLKNYIVHRNKECLRNLNETIFYVAILLTAVNYLQKRRILHRDLKPDNCMIDHKGYLKIIDFGVAKDLANKDYTHTVLGTPHYMAPEILLGKGYSYSVDYWSIGVIAYEIFYGTLPFGNDSEDLVEIYKDITEK
jgi:cGMP-dependent protein kinase